MSEWQPIETAPKDGTVVLLYGVWEGEINGLCDAPEIGTGSLRGGAWYTNRGDAYYELCHATHWAPVTPPIAEEPARVGCWEE